MQQKYREQNGYQKFIIKKQTEKPWAEKQFGEQGETT